ncbi:flavin monoamine oxidase family protein [Marinobacter sp.]|uniref:flavin monoamine oxidase family protein n=1 Tax=Marinobacter sp. TaxID=50741 RepID=UPI00384CA30D
MQTAQVAIVGAGLAGLYAAFLLEQKGIRDYVLLEARDIPGGRIASTSAAGQSSSESVPDSFDLGPAWFWPGFQRQMASLVEALGLESFEQFETGEMMLDRLPSEPPMRMRGYVNSPPSMRLAGGMSALINALYSRLDATRIFTGQAVRSLSATETGVELDSEDAEGRVTTWQADHVLLAIPPRLAESGIRFAPALPSALSSQWRETATWMAPHAKYVAIYDSPFWRDQGLSGAARSALGPLGEIHDASMPGGSAALFGFFGVPAHVRMGVPEEELREHCRAQLARLFGPKALTPRGEFIKDWAREPYTSTAADQQPGVQHAAAPAATADAGPWSNRLTGIASEWGPQFPGYLAGAIEAASLGVAGLVSGNS